jgi:hypothetical protein
VTTIIAPALAVNPAVRTLLSPNVRLCLGESISLYSQHIATKTYHSLHTLRWVHYILRFKILSILRRVQHHGAGGHWFWRIEHTTLELLDDRVTERDAICTSLSTNVGTEYAKVWFCVILFCVLQVMLHLVPPTATTSGDVALGSVFLLKWSKNQPVKLR